MSVDQFFTPRIEAGRCWAWLHRTGIVPAGAFYIEPSAGTGAFYDMMPVGQRTGYELDRELAFKLGVQQADFLSLDPLTTSWPGPAVVVGNPPFGRNGALAAEFVRQSFRLGAEVVAMILPGFALRRAVKAGGVVASRPVQDDRYELPAGGRRRVENCTFAVYERGKAAVKAAADGRVEAHTINRAAWRVKAGRTYGEAWIGKCDFYLTAGGYDGYLQAYDEYCQPEMIGVIVKEDRARLLPYLRFLDWSAAAKPCLGRRKIITPAVVSAAAARFP